MSKIGILHKGEPYTLRLTVTDQNGVVVNLNTINDLLVIVYADKTGEVLKRFTKTDLVIANPATGIALAKLTSAITQTALNKLYIVEYKYIIGIEERGKKGYWGTFASMKLENIHA